MNKNKPNVLIFSLISLTLLVAAVLIGKLALAQTNSFLHIGTGTIDNNVSVNETDNKDDIVIDTNSPSIDTGTTNDLPTLQPPATIPILYGFIEDTIGWIEGISQLIDYITPPIYILPDLPKDEVLPPTPKELSRWQGFIKYWREIKEKGEQEKTIAFQERKEIFDAWFNKMIQEKTLIVPSAWLYTLLKFDFSYDWAWAQFERDHPDFIKTI